MRLASVLLLFMISSSFAQVKVCIDDKGKKTFTDFECDKLGQQQATTIKDINITPKQCPAIKDSIVNAQNAIARMDASPTSLITPGYTYLRNLQLQSIGSNQLRYQRECVR